MAYESARKHKEVANEYRRAEEFSEAGDYFTTAAYAYLGDSPPKTGLGITNAEYCLLQAVVCYRLGDQFSRAVNRSRQGILIAEDVLDRVLAAETPENVYDRARRGALYEFIGDFRVVGDLDGADEAYDAAVEIYEEAGDPTTGYSEQERMRLMDFLDLVGTAVGEELEASWRTGQHNSTFTEWVAYKRDQLPSVVTELMALGTWNWDDV